MRGDNKCYLNTEPCQKTVGEALDLENVAAYSSLYRLPVINIVSSI